MKHTPRLLRSALILLLLAAPLASATDVRPPAPVWRFFAGEEYPGAKGSIKVRREDGGYVGTLVFDFTGGGLYVAGRHSIDVPAGFTELQIQVRSSEPRRLGLRLIDDAGQCHQFERHYEGFGEWTKIGVDLVHFRPKESWGGPADKKLYFPIREIQFVVGKDRRQPAEMQKGSVEFGEVVAVP